MHMSIKRINKANNVIMEGNKLSERYIKLINISLVLLNVGMLFGQKITGRLAYSNIFQIMSFFCIIPVILKTLNKKSYTFIILNFAMIIIAELYMTHIYNITPKFQHFTFFFLMFNYIILFYLVSSKYNIESVINKIYQSFIVPLLVYFVIFALYELIIAGSSFIKLGFDDKSHTVMICSFFAFINLVLLKSATKYIISLFFMGLSLLTISRLSIIFLSFYIVSFLYSYVYNFKTLLRSKKRTRYLKFYFNSVLFILTIVFGIWYLIQNYNQFDVFNRVNSLSQIKNSGSTIGHMLLIKYGLLLKFQNIITFVFGIGPGNFSYVAINSGINLNEFSAIDPTGFNAMLRGIMPMHSVHISVFTEFPIVFFISYLYLLARILTALLKKKLFIECMFFMAFIISTSFYSSHNELFFYSILIYFINRTFYNVSSRKM